MDALCMDPAQSIQTIAAFSFLQPEHSSAFATDAFFKDRQLPSSHDCLNDVAKADPSSAIVATLNGFGPSS
jgi:hypothetical protein